MNQYVTIKLYKNLFIIKGNLLFLLGTDWPNIYYSRTEEESHRKRTIIKIRFISTVILLIISHSLAANETFDKGAVGTMPDSWIAGITGNGVPIWQLEKDSTAPSSPMVFKQSGKGDFPWSVKKDSYLTNGFVAVKFKAISGRIDQAAGLIWRWKDANNYYVARANALENNVSIYYVKNGRRVTLKYAEVPDNLLVKRNVWQDFRVGFKGEHFIVSFEGKTILDIKDDHIKGGGAVGVWTKADSVTAFDDFTYGEEGAGK